MVTELRMLNHDEMGIVVAKDGNSGGHDDGHPTCTCFKVSEDGIHGG